MRPPRIRFTVRRLMFVVAATALLLGAWIQTVRLRRWSGRAEYLALLHATDERAYRQAAELPPRSLPAGAEVSLGTFAIEGTGPEDWRRGMFDRRVEYFADDGNVARKADYHAAMKAKYARAARYPWLPVAPDPPEPE